MTNAEARELLAQAASDDVTGNEDSPPQTEGTAEGAVMPETDNSIDAIVQQITANPDNAKEIITQMQRSLGGQYGSEIDSLRNEMLAKENQMNQRLESQTTPSADDPDAYGLTEADYARLGEVIQKTPQYKEQVQQQEATSLQTKQTQATQFLANMKAQYGDAITDGELATFNRLIKLYNYDAQNAELQDEYKKIVQVAESRKRSTQGEINEEQKRREELAQRISISNDTPRTDTTVAGASDLWKKSKGDSGRTTNKSVIAAGKAFMRNL